MQRVLVSPSGVPAVLPQGCLNDPSKLGLTSVCEASDLDALAGAFFSAAEKEVAGMLGLTGQDQQKLCGRADGPTFVMLCAVGPEAKREGKCSRVTLAWECVAAWLGRLLVHWPSDHNVPSCCSHTFSRTRWKLLNTCWKYLGDGRGALAFRTWVNCLRFDMLSVKCLVVAARRATGGIAKAARLHDEHQSRVAWQNWLQEGPARGLGRQHKISRVSSGWVPSRALAVSQVDAQDIDDQVCFDDIEGVSETDS